MSRSTIGKILQKRTLDLFFQKSEKSTPVQVAEAKAEGQSSGFVEAFGGKWISVLFIHEKLLIVEGKHNSQNNWVYATNKSAIPDESFEGPKGAETFKCFGLSWSFHLWSHELDLHSIWRVNHCNVSDIIAGLESIGNSIWSILKTKVNVKHATNLKAL